MPSSRPISPMSASEARNRNDEPRAVTKSQRRRARSMMSSSGSASATAAYGPASPRRRNGSTAMDGFIDSARTASGLAAAASDTITLSAWTAFTGTTNRKPCPCTVRM